MVQVTMSQDEYAARLERKLARLTVENEALHEELGRRLAAEQADAADEAPSEEKPVRLPKRRPKLARLPDRATPAEEPSPGA